MTQRWKIFGIKIWLMFSFLIEPPNRVWCLVIVVWKEIKTTMNLQNNKSNNMFSTVAATFTFIWISHKFFAINVTFNNALHHFSKSKSIFAAIMNQIPFRVSYMILRVLGFGKVSVKHKLDQNWDAVFLSWTAGLPTLKTYFHRTGVE